MEWGPGCVTRSTDAESDAQIHARTGEVNMMSFPSRPFACTVLCTHAFVKHSLCDLVLHSGVLSSGAFGLSGRCSLFHFSLHLFPPITSSCM